MSRSRAHAAFAFLTAALVCCTSWGPPFHRSRLAPASLPQPLRLLLADGRRVEMSNPALAGDTLVGDTIGVPQASGRFAPARIPLSAIDSVSTLHVDAATTTVAVALAAGGAIALAVGIHSIGDDLSKQSCNPGPLP